MNKYKNIHHINFGVKGQIVHSILTMIGLLPFYFFFVACSDEIQNELTTENLRDNEALVHLTVNLPSSSVPRNTDVYKRQPHVYHGIDSSGTTDKHLSFILRIQIQKYIPAQESRLQSESPR